MKTTSDSSTSGTNTTNEEEGIDLQPRRRVQTNSTKKKFKFPGRFYFILGTEFSERFCFYGMRALLVLFLVSFGYTANKATSIFHFFVFLCYFLPVVGAFLADCWLGKYRTIFYFSGFYSVGCFLLSLSAKISSKTFVFISLLLIAIGSACIKPNVSAFLSDQLTDISERLLTRIYSLFYLSVNIGSVLSTLTTPLVEMHLNYWTAFGIPAIVMFIAVTIFRSGKSWYIIVPATDQLLKKFLNVIYTALRNKFWLGKSQKWDKDHWLDWAKETNEGNPKRGREAQDNEIQNMGKHKLHSKNNTDSNSGYDSELNTNSSGNNNGSTINNINIGSDSNYLQSNNNKNKKKKKKNNKTKRNENEKGTDSSNSDSNSDTNNQNKPRAHHKVQYVKSNLEFIADLKIFLHAIQIFIPLPVFWALFDQHSSTWVLQAKEMKLEIKLGSWKASIPPGQVMALNPALLMIMIPLFDKVIYPLLHRFDIRFAPLKRISIGLLFTVSSFLAAAILQIKIDQAGYGKVHWTWQIPQYTLLCVGETLVSITGLQLAISESPGSTRSLMQAVWLLTTGFGNLLVSVVEEIDFFQKERDQFLFFAALMLLFFFIFLIVAKRYTYSEQWRLKHAPNYHHHQRSSNIRKNIKNRTKYSEMSNSDHLLLDNSSQDISLSEKV
ncbi:solute carrier family 15 member 2 [Anaeramoeba flamelloides]|uniref:Solute carrier family 15 member 2 n=1 Tax=Anaeramoeba flamelloides TaxID=1746091 RepID=A0ABQ8Y6H9_9EUKA|nr:solute carrier family 15 member 2 [Anaeramoeba flamelloides]